MKQKTLVFRTAALAAAFTGLLFAMPGTAYAHVLKTDGTIGAVMHVDPDDDPVAGTASNFYFDVKDKSGRFKAADCACSMRVRRGDEQLAAVAMNGTTNASYTFPATGTYRITFSGAPVAGADFQQFSLAYSLRVERTAGTAGAAAGPAKDAGGNLGLWLTAGFGVLAVGLAAALVLASRGRPKPNKP